MLVHQPQRDRVRRVVVPPAGRHTDTSRSDSDRAICRNLEDITNGHVTFARNLWFIDYTIRQHPGVKETAKRRQEFWSIQGRFVKVSYADSCWDLGSQEVFAFVDHLRDDVQEFFMEVRGVDEWNREGSDDDQCPATLEVLAFEAFDQWSGGLIFGLRMDIGGHLKMSDRGAHYPATALCQTAQPRSNDCDIVKRDAECIRQGITCRIKQDILAV